MRDRVLVVGGGVIGLSCAWQLARRGHDTILVGTSPGRSGAAWVAAGMLAPVTEVQFGERTLTSLLLEGASHWKDFATSLEETTGRDIGYDQTGTITVAVTPSDRAVLLDLLAYQLQLGCTAHRRSVSECRTSVPALAPTLSGGIEVPDDHHVDNRALLSALLEACRSAGVELVEEEVMALSTDNGPTVTLTSGTRLGASTIVLAAGVGTADIAGMEGLGLPEIRPVKGHILRLGPFPGTPQLGRTVRGLVHGRSVYLVPRPDKTLVVGATMEERGRDTTVQAGAVQQLLADARTIVPGVDEMELLEASAGLRPSTADNRPCIGWTNVPGVMAAVGHFRNGILLAPLTAHAVGSLLEGQSVSSTVTGLAPRP